MRKSARHIVIVENLYFPGVLDLDFPPKHVDAHGSAEVCSS